MFRIVRVRFRLDLLKFLRIIFKDIFLSYDIVLYGNSCLFFIFDYLLYTVHVVSLAVSTS